MKRSRTRVSVIESRFDLNFERIMAFNYPYLSKDALKDVARESFDEQGRSSARNAGE